MAAGSSNYWEDLRKQARQLENELDLKLVSFSKLCTSYSSSRDGRRDSSDTTPLLNGSSQDRMFETMAVEIEQLLGKLTGINDKMAEYTNSAGVPSLNAALMHTLQRHRDILQDYTHEFHKTKANFLAIRERENLLGSVRKDIESYKSGSGVNNRRTELFLKEHEHLRNCRGHTDAWAVPAPADTHFSTASPSSSLGNRENAGKPANSPIPFSIPRCLGKQQGGRNVMSSSLAACLLCSLRTAELHFSQAQ
ncbi:Golgi SNAP receptor complex member 1 isoform X2 [Onychostruthus taczanowskii]|uniref:Golgi SNAP receptor complex member 1 isoform X2 n=1 Tax=Onychostruthus taczanowskii TaxID=356909 RepID=UPI001B80DC86|nr:Golgi SNAP receptor complex member 1 isoform X2 [Onychostruthus taczanowskii]